MVRSSQPWTPLGKTRMGNFWRQYRESPPLPSVWLKCVSMLQKKQGKGLSRNEKARQSLKTGMERKEITEIPTVQEKVARFGIPFLHTKCSSIFDNRSLIKGSHNFSAAAPEIFRFLIFCRIESGFCWCGERHLRNCKNERLVLPADQRGRGVVPRLPDRFTPSVSG